MAVEFRLPDIGEGIAEGEIVKWLVKPGDLVKEDQAMVEVMTDKVTAEIPSPFTGVIQSLNAKEGDVVKVGSVIVMIETQSSGPNPVEKNAETPVIKAANSGAANGSLTQVGVSDAVKVLAAPATRKLARELGIQLISVAGSGPKGRITPEDIRRQAGSGVSSPSTQSPSPVAVTSSVSTSIQSVSTAPSSVSKSNGAGGSEVRVPFVGMRRKIAENLVASKRNAPHFAYVEEVEMTALVSLKESLKSHAQDQGVKLTYLPFILKAVVAGLKAYPVLNALLDETTQELVYKHYYNLGIAVSTDQGLTVPVIHDVDQKSVLQLAQEIKALSEKARAGKLSLDERRGGTFTVTSIGSIGGLFGVPIINYPEVAIMGINKITKRPVVRTNHDGNDEIVIREMMNLSICCDHRVVDGAEAALFTKKVIEILETPGLLLL
jgi:pyruvate dehydrogenase E2 component (dihydrolipoamide acetyltransferase)